MRQIKNVRLVSLTDRVYVELVNGVIAGELAPGDKLTDRRLASQLGVSRTPIREALQRLVSGGLVDPRGRAGWTVAVLSPRDIRELFELRSLLEPVGIRRIVRDKDEATAAELLAYFDRFGDVVPDSRYAEYFSADRSFHSRIVDLSQNRRLVAAYRTVELQVDLGRHRLLSQSRQRVEQTLKEHRAIAAALAAGDAEAALAALASHLTNGEAMMLESFQAHGEKTSGRTGSPASH